jgi:hypothetical protein
MSVFVLPTTTTFATGCPRRQLAAAGVEARVRR